MVGREKDQFQVARINDEVRGWWLRVGKNKISVARCKFQVASINTAVRLEEENPLSAVKSRPQKEQFFVPTLRIQVTGKTRIRRLRREIYARDKTFAALMRRRERK